ncbi:MAG: type II toxin-antitoxin system RelE/ParE family toxin [Ignavibacteriales bacterium]|nr:type II toxin-antitoxin system RelE/ParE family toxin [Ignavibacteriales bacterium]
MLTKLYWTKSAQQDLEKILDYLKVEWTETTAFDFLTKLENQLKILNQFPFIGKIIFKPKLIRAFVFSKQVTIIYRLIDNKIVILKLFDNRQSPKKLLISERIEAYGV